MGTQDLITLQGYIRGLPYLPGKGDETARVALVTDDGTETAILHKGVGVELAQHISANAKLTGVLIPHEEGDMLSVRSFTLTDGFEDEWYDDSTE